MDAPVRMTMFTFLLWILLLVFCWPLALLALVLYPIVWLLLLPFRIVGIAVEGVFELLRAVIFLPARLLGGGPARGRACSNLPRTCKTAATSRSSRAVADRCSLRDLHRGRGRFSPPALQHRSCRAVSPSSARMGGMV